MLQVRKLLPDDVPALADIVRRLPGYFTDDVPGKVSIDAGRHGGWVIVDRDGIAGFAVVDQRSPAVSEILWIAVDPARRRRGVGTLLLEHVLGVLAAGGVSLVEAKTLDASAGYEPYEATRGFWEARGFVMVDTIDPLPDWQPGNPCAIYVAAVRPTRGPISR
ncbi:MAG: GNAT family N-acetyltransferase [Acidimicrobiales bacterium]